MQEHIKVLRYKLLIIGKEKKSNCCACTCKCWCISIIVCLLVVGLVFLILYLVVASKFTGEATDENWGEWDAKLKESANGTLIRNPSDLKGV